MNLLNSNIVEEILLSHIKNNPEKKGISSLIRYFRKLRNLTQSELGAKIGVSFQQVQKYERGKDNVPIPRLRDIAKTLGVPLSAFFIGEDDIEDNSNNKNELIKQVAASMNNDNGDIAFITKAIVNLMKIKDQAQKDVILSLLNLANGEKV